MTFTSSQVQPSYSIHIAVLTAIRWQLCQPISVH